MCCAECIYRIISVLGIFSLLSSCHIDDSRNSLASYIDTRVGTSASVTKTAGLFGKNTEEFGQTLPAVLEPRGMNFWTPQTRDSERKCIAPYYYADKKIQGFRNSHWIVGGCTQDYGSMTIMPLSRSLICLPEERASNFSHQQEIATPYYYSCFLNDYGIKAEMTGTSRAAIFRFTYMEDTQAYIVANPNSDEGEGCIKIDTLNNEISGSNPVHRIYQGWGKNAGFSGHFVVRLDRKPNIYGVYSDSIMYDSVLSISNKKNIGAYVGLKVKKGDVVTVKIGTSFTSEMAAVSNLVAEIPHWDFDKVKNTLKTTWEDELSKIEVDGTVGDKRKFYGAMYRVSFLPRTFNDIDGTYPAFSSEGKLNKVEEGNYYDDFSTWDTYRALHPLQVIINPEVSSQMVRSLIDKYEQKKWLPIFPCWNSYTSAMIGDHCISVISDAFIKGITGFNIEKAYEAMRKNAFVIPDDYNEYRDGMGRRALDSYIKYGYIPLEDSVKESFHTCEQVSRTLEYAYDDFVLGQVAKKLGKKEDYITLMRRGLNYRNVIEPKSGYALGRYSDGKFIDNHTPFDFVSYITEGAPCHYTWYVPQDVKGLSEIMGGDSVFINKLDSMFTEKRYWHGNEPCHQIAYLYNYVCQPWKTQEKVRYIMETEYLDDIGGLSGNDDAGQMSAWFVFSSIGFYPVCPGTPYYVIGSPLFKKTVISLSNGNKFVVIANNVSKENKYICSAKLNGKEYNKNYISHNDIVNGGVLELEMSDKPNIYWASSQDSCPPSYY